MSADELFDEETKEALKQIFSEFKRKVVDYLVVDNPDDPPGDPPDDPPDEDVEEHHHHHEEGAGTTVTPLEHVHRHVEGCPTCGEAKMLANALMSLANGKLEFRIIKQDDAEASVLRPRYVPGFIYGSPKKNIRYYGLPSGQEFAPFIYVHQYIANDIIKLPSEVVEKVKEIDTPLHIKIFVTPECPYCPLTVDAFNQMALINDKLLVETIEAVELPMEADMYGVAYVPDVIITDPDKQGEYGVEPVERINGYMPPEETVEILLYAAEKLKEIRKNKK
jgi:thiol-disulfide isomerase/thioredoxin